MRVRFTFNNEKECADAENSINQTSDYTTWQDDNTIEIHDITQSDAKSFADNFGADLEIYDAIDDEWNDA